MTKTTFVGLIMALVAGPALALQGQVVESGTGRPLPGVFVFVWWMGDMSIAVQPATRCYKADILTTDSEGRFQVPEMSGNINPLITDRRRNLRFYKPGYREMVRAAASDRVVMGKRDPQKRAQSFVEVFEETLPSYCDFADKKLLSVLKAMDPEVTALAETQREKERSLGTKYAIERIELGEEAARRNLDERFAALRAKGRSQ